MNNCNSTGLQRSPGSRSVVLVARAGSAIVFSRGRSRHQPWRWLSQGSSIAGGIVAGMGGTKDRPGCGNIVDMSGEITAGVEGGPHGTPVKLSMTRMRRERTLSGKRHWTNGVVRQVMKMEAMVTDLDCSTMRSRVGEEASPTSAWSEHLRGNAIAFRGWANLRTSCNGKGAAREILKRKTNGVIAGARRRQRELRGDADTNLGIDTSARSVAL